MSWVTLCAGKAGRRHPITLHGVPLVIYTDRGSLTPFVAWSLRIEHASAVPGTDVNGLVLHDSRDGGITGIVVSVYHAGVPLEWYKHVTRLTMYEIVQAGLRTNRELLRALLRKITPEILHMLWPGPTAHEEYVEHGC